MDEVCTLQAAAGGSWGTEHSRQAGGCSLALLSAASGFSGCHCIHVKNSWRREFTTPVVAFLLFVCRKILHIVEISDLVSFISKVFPFFLASMSISRTEENINIIGNSIVAGREKSTTHMLIRFTFFSA